MYVSLTHSSARSPTWLWAHLASDYWVMTWAGRAPGLTVGGGLATGSRQLARGVALVFTSCELRRLIAIAIQSYF